MKADGISILIYAVPFFITILLIKLYKRSYIRTKIGNYVFLLICSLPLSMVAGFRYNVGTDFRTYENMFRIIGGISFLECFTQNITEIGFALLIKVTNLINDDVGFAFFLTSLITLYIAFFAFSRMKELFRMDLAITIYLSLFYFQSLNIIRQCLAISIIILALSYLFENKNVKFFVCYACACMIHTSASICIIFYFLYKLFYQKQFSQNRGKLIAYYVVLCGSPIIVSYLFPIVMSSTLFSRYSYYTTITDFSGIGIGFVIECAMILLPGFFWGMEKIKFGSEYSSYYIYLMSTMFLIIPFFVASYFASWASRMSLYVWAIVPIWISLLITDHKKTISGNENTIRIYYFVYFAVKFIVEYLFLNYAQAFPYMFR